MFLDIFGVLGTWASALLLGYFAYKQNKISKDNLFFEQSRMYIEVSIKLASIIASLNKLTKVIIYEDDKQILEILLSEVNFIYFQSNLYLSSEISDFIYPIVRALENMQQIYKDFAINKSRIDSLNNTCNGKIITISGIINLDDNFHHTTYYKKYDEYYIKNTHEVADQDLTGFCESTLCEIINIKNSLSSSILPPYYGYSLSAISDKFRKFTMMKSTLHGCKY